MELLSLHVVSETSKGEISPAHIERVRSWMTQTDQLPHRDIAYSRPFETLRQDVLIELRVTPRTRNCSDIDDSVNAIRTKNAKEIVYGSCSVPDGQNRHGEAPLTKVIGTCPDNALRVRFLTVKIRCGKKLIELQDHEKPRPIKECQKNS